MSDSAILRDRLDFMLHPFLRVCWASDPARDRWSPRLLRIARAWPAIEIAAIGRGSRRCAALRISAEHLAARSPEWAARGLAIDVLPHATGKPSLFTVCVGYQADVQAYGRARAARDSNTMGALLGYPLCCRQRFVDVSRRGPLLDYTWTFVENGPTTLDAASYPAVNPLWRPLGVMLVPHLPCALDCAETERNGLDFLSCARQAGFHEEADWLADILSWPAEWSGLHGIAELKTPILRVATRTDATAAKRVIRAESPRYPAEGAKGVRFPYQASRPRPTQSVAFLKGLERNRQVIPVRPVH
jgi:hypothetical protein